jgi:hypothetical protein
VLLLTSSHWTVSPSDNLRALLTSLLDLPLEIFDMIFVKIESCAFLAFLSVESVQKDLKHIDETTTGETRECRLEEVMTFYFPQVKGEMHLCGCDNGKQLIGYAGETEEVILPEHIDALKFTMGPFGIRCLQFNQKIRPLNGSKIIRAHQTHFCLHKLNPETTLSVST